MADDHGWRRLESELARWRDAERIAGLWLRDDDAIEPSAALERLIALANRHSIALTLAVIPARARNALAQRLSTEPNVAAAVHGWAHANHALTGEKKQELGLHRPSGVVAAELARAKAAIDGLFGARAVPLLVPPWNRIAPEIIPLLGELGFAALSAFGRAQGASIRFVNAHLDLIDWHGSRGGRNHGELVAALVEELRWRRETGSEEPLGILGHHLVHDETAWSFLERLLEATATDPACRWSSVRDLI